MYICVVRMLLSFVFKTSMLKGISEFSSKAVCYVQCMIDDIFSSLPSCFIFNTAVISLAGDSPRGAFDIYLVSPVLSSLAYGQWKTCLCLCIHSDWHRALHEVDSYQMSIELLK